MENADYQALREKQQQAQQRAWEKKKAKQADPEYRQKQYEKKKAASQKAIARLVVKQQSPEWKAEQKKKAEKRSVRAQERVEKKKAAPAKVIPVKRASASGRGLKGRTPTAAERVVMDALGKLPCIACFQHGKVSPRISLHHINGRTKAGAHMLQLPLCIPHHQHAAPAEVRAMFPWLVPVHADGNTGGKAEFSRHNGTESELMVKAYELAGIAHLMPAV